MANEGTRSDRWVARSTANVLDVIAQSMELATSPATVIKKCSNLLKGLAARSAFDELRRRVNEKVADGTIKLERLTAPEVTTALGELLADHKDAVPDARRVHLLHALFFATLIGDPADSEGTMALVFVRTARKLQAEDGAVLASAFRHRRDYMEREAGFDAALPWREVAMRESGLAHMEPLYDSLARLMRARLLSGSPDNHLTPPWPPGPNGPLTPFGLAFCEFLHRADSLGAAPE